MTSLTKETLQRAFKQYRFELNESLRAECYLSALHLAVVIPDICAALETTDGKTTSALYQQWCGRHISGPTTITPSDRYQIRCHLLHEGSSLTEGPTVKSNYASVSFVVPGQGPVGRRVHGEVGSLSDGPNLIIDIDGFANETAAALDRWFNWLQLPSQAPVRINVAQRLDRVLSARPKALLDPNYQPIVLNFSSTEFNPAWKLGLVH